jgi:hypothetical protein
MMNTSIGVFSFSDFQSELFPYSNEDSGFFRGVVRVNS